MIQSEVRFPQGGDNLNLDVTVLDQDQALINLMGATVQLLVKRNDTTVTVNGTLTNPTAGQCRFVLKNTDVLSEAGGYPARVKVTIATEIIPSRWFQINVE